MAEWLKALVLKTRDGNIRRFESCPFRHVLTDVHKKTDSRNLALLDANPVLTAKKSSVLTFFCGKMEIIRLC